MSRPVSEAEARVAIGALHCRYIACIDGGRADALALLFTADGILESKITGRQNVGRTRIEEYLGEVIASRKVPAWRTIHHHLAPSLVSILEEGRARTECYFVAFSSAGIDHWGMYSDEVVQTLEGWLFARRSVSLIGATPGGWVASGSAGLPGAS